MSAQVATVEPFEMVVFGATGDLASRKLLPSLYLRDSAGQLPARSRIIGVSRQSLTPDDFRAFAESSLRTYLRPADIVPCHVSRFLSRLLYFAVDATAGTGWQTLAAALGIEGVCKTRIFYLATSPQLFGIICSHLCAAGLLLPGARVVLEKPIGSDLKSARDINDAIGSVLPEECIYRIDHYLGKETVQNLMALRFANSLFEPLWNAAHVDHVQITVSEDASVAGRVSYYERAGALRDMVQNHLLQLLCLVAMEPPATLTADAVRNEKLKVLMALRPLIGRDVPLMTVRGQYRAGAMNGRSVPGYGDELGHNASSTETFVALRAEIGNWRWAGVPFYLRTGKRLAKKVSEIVIYFHAIKHSVFDGSSGPVRSNRLVMRLQPDDGVKLWLMIKDPGLGGMRLRHVPLNMAFAEAFQVRHADAYERLLLDVMRGNQTLFMRRDEVEAAWRWVDPILHAWRQSKDEPRPYAAGSWGPSAAVALIERDGRTWHEDDYESSRVQGTDT